MTSRFYIEVELEVDYLEHKEKFDKLAERIVYTGPIDAYFGYELGFLEYRSVRFENELLDIPNFQGNAAVNYTDSETPWTRIIEHKWFEFGKNAAYLTLIYNIRQKNIYELQIIDKIFKLLFCETRLCLKIDYRELWLLENAIIILINIYLDENLLNFTDRI